MHNRIEKNKISDYPRLRSISVGVPLFQNADKADTKQRRFTRIKNQRSIKSRNRTQALRLYYYWIYVLWVIVNFNESMSC